MTTDCTKQRWPQRSQTARRRDDHRMQQGDRTTEWKKESGPQHARRRQDHRMEEGDRTTEYKKGKRDHGAEMEIK